MKRPTRWPVLILTLAATAALSWLAAAPPRPEPDVLRRDLARILAQPQYRQAPSSWLYGYLLRLLRSVPAWWEQHVGQRLERLAEQAPILYWAVVALFLLLALLLIYHIYVTMRSAFGTGRRRARSVSHEPVTPLTREPDVLLGRADEAAAAGRFAEALRYLYLALVHHLDRQSILRYDLSHTNHEYLRQARQHPAVLEPLRAVTGLADRAWYSQYGLGYSDYERARALVETAWQEGERAAAT